MNRILKAILAAALSLFGISVTAESKLPQCPISGDWTNCHGTYVHAANDAFKGDKYIGEFKDGKPHGIGTYTRATICWAGGKCKAGETYSTSWINGIPSGEGTALLAVTNAGTACAPVDPLTKAEGSYKTDKFVGTIRTACANSGGRLWNFPIEVEISNLPQSSYLTGKLEPLIKVVEADGNMPVFLSELKSKFGSTLPLCANPSLRNSCFDFYAHSEDGPFMGDMFVGEFNRGIPNGSGVYKSKLDDMIYVANWQNGMPIGKGKVIGTYQYSGSPITYEGSFVAGLFSGQGKYQHTQGTKFGTDSLANKKVLILNPDKYASESAFTLNRYQWGITFADLNLSSQIFPAEILASATSMERKVPDIESEKIDNQKANHEVKELVATPELAEKDEVLRLQRQKIAQEQEASRVQLAQQASQTIERQRSEEELQKQQLARLEEIQKQKIIDEQRQIALAEEKRRTQAQLELQNAREAELVAEAQAAKKMQAQAEEKLKQEALAAALREKELQRKLAAAETQAREQQNIKDLAVRAEVVYANRKALIIGNDNYRNVTKLENAREDARAIAENMQKVGYKVTLKLDLTEKEMKTALRNFSSQVEGGDEVMIFYAGHGVQLGAANYLLPIDIGGESESQVKDEAIPLQRLLDDMGERKVKFALAIIDACRDNPFKAAGRAIGGRGLSPTTAATGQMVIFSAGTGQQALDRLGPTDKGKNGIFTRVFLKEMLVPGITIDKVVRNVRNQVVGLANSVGHEQVPAIYDQVVGDFYFMKSDK
jgi:hypothetical protein